MFGEIFIKCSQSAKQDFRNMYFFQPKNRVLDVEERKKYDCRIFIYVFWVEDFFGNKDFCLRQDNWP